MAYIQENFCDSELTLESIGNKFNMNPQYINLLFKQNIGFNIHHFILLNRVSIAKRSLENGMNVTKACGFSGFNDYANFLRTFKKHTGYTPKQYQKKVMTAE